MRIEIQGVTQCEAQGNFTYFFNILKVFWFHLEDVLKIIFLHGEIFEFP